MEAEKISTRLNLDPSRYSRLTREMDRLGALMNQNRQEYERLNAEKNRANESKRLMLSQPRVSPAEVEAADRQLKAIETAQSNVNAEYAAISSEMQPLIKLRDSARDCLLAHRIALPSISTGAQVVMNPPRDGGRFKLLKVVAKAAGKISDPLKEVEKISGERQALIRERQHIENLPVAGAEVVAAWDAIISEQKEIFRRSSPCSDLPDRRELNLIPDTAADPNGLIRLQSLLPMICALVGDQLRAHVREVNSDDREGISSADRRREHDQLDQKLLELDHRFERAARAVEEATGAFVPRPADLDPRAFLARDV